MLSFNYILITIGTNFVTGFNPPISAIVTYLILLAVFDTTMMLYTIPTSYLISKTIDKNLKIGKIAKEPEYQPPALKPETET
jgi:hypothetical protein